MRILYPEVKGCDPHLLPEAPRVDGALTACSACRQWFFSYFDYNGFGGGYVWKHVRWYHWRLGRRIEAYLKRNRGLIEQYIPDDFEPPSMAL